MSKRIFSFLLAIVMVLSLLPATALKTEAATDPAFIVQPTGGAALSNELITVTWATNFTPEKLVLRRTIEHPVDGLVNSYTTLSNTATSHQLSAVSSGYYTLLAYYSESKYITSNKIYVPKFSKGTPVIFTADSVFKVGQTATVDIEAMAENDENLMDAYFNNKVNYQWRSDGSVIGSATGESYTFTRSDAGKNIQVAVIYGDYMSVSESETVAKSSIWVGGVEMADGTYLANGATSPTTVQPTGGYAYYKDGTLILHNYEYEGPGYSFANSLGVVFGAAVYSDDVLDVFLEGENVLNQTIPSYSIYCKNDLYIEGAGSLLISDDITSDIGNIWIAGGSISTSIIDTSISAMNNSVAISGGNISCRIHACYDIEIAAGKVNAVSNYSVLDAGRDIIIYGGSVTAKTTHWWADENSWAVEFDGTFTVVPSLVIRASADPDGTLGTYVAADHNTYDLVVIEEPAFTKQPVSGAVPAGDKLTVDWETNFQPLKIEIYYISSSNDEVLYEILPGTATSAELAVRTEDYYIVAYYSDSVYTESNRFKVTEAATTTVYFCFGNSPIASQDVVVGQCAVEPDNPAQEGKTFLGWYTEDGELYDFSTPVTDELYLYAKFGHYVNFLWAKDDPIFGVPVEHGKPVGEPAEPAQEGKTFLGWYTEDGELYDFSTPVTGDFNLYAKFGHYVNFLWAKDDPIFGVPVEHGKPVGEPAEPAQEGKTFLGWYTEDGKLYDFSTPVTGDFNLYAKFEAAIPVPAKPYKIANVVSGVHVYWKATEGAVKYGLWRSETGVNGTYKWVANPTVPHFTDTKVESGKTYYYKVTAMNAAGQHSDKSEPIGITYVSTPDITSRSNIAAGVKLGWEKITGATGYAIYRKSYSGTDAWVRVGTISGNSTFTWTDTSVKNNNGTIYKYTIRALAGSDMKTLSGCRNAGRTMARLSSQVMTSAAKASSTSIKCQWTTSSRVTGYEVRFMVGDTVYKTFTVGNYKTGVKTFTGLKAGQTYKIQVRTYLKVDGMGFYSDWSEAKNVKI